MVNICLVVTARPSWAKWQTIAGALHGAPGVNLQIVTAGAAQLERYGCVRDVICMRGMPIVAEHYTVIEGANLVTSARETGLLMMDLAATFNRLEPDLVCVMADRHEVLAAAAAARYLHIPLAHLQGGEVTGSIDDRVRDAVTQLADYHFPATAAATHRVALMAARHALGVYNYGCPSIDLAKRAQDSEPVTDYELGGTGAGMDLNQPFLVVLQHPVTTEVEYAYTQMWATLSAVGNVNLPRIVFWPGEDAGAEAASKAIRDMREQRPGLAWRTVRSLPPARFLKLLTQAAVLVGNSSAGIRECSYLGVPVVNIGNRQRGRERGVNVIDVPHNPYTIARAVGASIGQPVASSTLYGDGTAGARIAERLINVCTRHHSGTGGVQGGAGEKSKAA